MGKNIILTEEQFKRYVKGVLLNEGLQFIKPNASQPAMEPKELAKKIKDWAGDDDVKYTLKDVFLDKKVPENVDVNTPMTFEAAGHALGYGSPMMQISSIIARAKANLVGEGNTKIAKQRKAEGRGFALKKSDESELKHQQRCVVGKEAKQELEKKQGYVEQDAMFRKSLQDLIANGDPNGKLEHSNLNPQEISTEDSFQKLFQYCKDERITCTESGEVYVPIKINMAEIRQLILNVNSRYYGMKASDMISKLPYKVLLNCIAKDPYMYPKVIKMDRFVRTGIVTPPIYKFVGLGDKNMSGVLCWFYQPENYR